MSYVRPTPFTQDGSCLEPLDSAGTLNQPENQVRARSSAVEHSLHTRRVEGSTPSAPTKCSVEGCGRTPRVRGMCDPHYLKAYRRGEFSTGRPRKDRQGEDFLALAIEIGKTRAARATECLIWPFRRQSRGYAIIHGQGEAELVSRRVCEAVRGPAPDGSPLALHNCDNGAGGCIEPTHLEWGSYRKNNVEDRIRAGTFRPWGKRNA